jgi:hypothetical protein
MVAMKTLTRMIQGVISSLLLSAGLSEAASRFDPLAQTASRSSEGTVGDSVPSFGCTLPCLYAPRPSR